MADIHRLLCTHCTFGTSELESSSGDNAGKVLGYSVRKSSLPDAERGQLRQVFRAVERLLSYALPKDATAVDKETLTADTAPRRLIFVPNLGGWQVAGQVSYRTYDTSQPPRPGSYFADLVVAKAADPRSRDPQASWSPCDVLALWAVACDRKPHRDCGWWIASEAELTTVEAEGPWKPTAPASVAAVREPRPPLIDDALAHRFLSAVDVAADPLVPARWWAMPPERRRELVAHMLQATLAGPARGGRETVTIAAEPSVAAVLFYIVCRLLPRRIAAGVSFSTYEPAPERPLTGLVATTFLNEQAPTADLPPELAQRGFACNTFRDAAHYGRCQPPPEQGYARRLIALAAENDWPGIDSLLTSLDAEGLKPADLDRLIEIDNLVDEYFRGARPKGLDVRRSPQEARFLRERFRSILESQAATRADWPSDLLEAAIFCLEGDLESLWQSSGPVHALLVKHIPADDEGLARLLEPPKGMPAPPRPIVVAATVAAALRARPPHLPKAFVKYCRTARDGRNRSAAVDLLREVVRDLPDDRRDGLLVGVDSASFTDLLLDVVRSLGPPEREPLRRTLTELLSNCVEKLTAKDLGAATELLARQSDVAESISANHPGLQTHLDDFFRVLLDDTAREPGRHLVDEAGRSRVAGLQRWADHALDRGRVGEALTHWKRLHDAVTRLAQDAPPWRSWAKPSPPDGREIPAAVAAVGGLRPFDEKNLGKALDRQRGLAAAVVGAFKSGQPDGSELRAGWETVGHWLDNALEAEADRRAPPRAGARPDRSPLVAYGVPAAGAALIVVLALGAYSQGLFDGLLKAGRQDDKPNLVADTADPAGPQKPNTHAGAKPVDPPGKVAATTAPAGGPPPPTTVPEPAAQRPSKPPPLTPADVDLKLTRDKGKVVVTWDHEKLKPRISGSPRIFWKGPKQTDHVEQPPTKEGQATIDTRDRGFGKYEVKLSVTPSAGNGTPFDKTESHSIEAPPPIQLSGPEIEVRDGKPLLKVKVAPVPDAKGYGEVSYRLTGPADFSRAEAADGDGTVRFELPETFTPQTYDQSWSQFRVTTVVPQGIGSEVAVPRIQLPDAKEQLLAILKRKHHVTALTEDPGSKPTTLCDLPWSLPPERVDIWLMTANFKPDTSLSLTKDGPGNKVPRWRCKDDRSDCVVGYVEIDPGRPWQPQLRFRPVEQKEAQHATAYAALRCCRLCFVIDGKSVATSQLAEQASSGPLKIQFPVPSKPLALTLPALQRVSDLVTDTDLVLTTSKPGPITHEELELSFEPPHLCLSGGAATPHLAAIKFGDGKVNVDRFHPPIKPGSRESISSKERVVESRKTALRKLQEELEKIPDGPQADGLRTRKPTDINKDIITTKENLADAEEKLKKATEDLQKSNAFAESVTKATFVISDWRIAWTTHVPADKGPLQTEIPGGTAVILIQGSAKGDPLTFVAEDKSKAAKAGTADASDPPADSP